MPSRPVRSAESGAIPMSSPKNGQALREFADRVPTTPRGWSAIEAGIEPGEPRASHFIDDPTPLERREIAVDELVHHLKLPARSLDRTQALRALRSRSGRSDRASRGDRGRCRAGRTKLHVQRLASSPSSRPSHPQGTVGARTHSGCSPALRTRASATLASRHAAGVQRVRSPSLPDSFMGYVQ